MKKRSLSLLGVLFVFLAVNFVSAGIFFSDLDSKYNLGDMINLDVDVEPFEEGSLLNVKLYCDGNAVIEFNNYPSDAGDVNIKLPLNFNTIDQANGNCYFSGEYNGETRNSNNFEISRLLTVSLSKDAFFANPGEQIIVSGSAKKLSGDPANGMVEISVPLLEGLKVINGTNSSESYDAGSSYGSVVGGDFSVVVSIPENAPAGDFRIDSLVYEEIKGQKASEGVAYANLKVFQVLNDVELNLNSQNFDPGAIVEIEPKLLDQTGVNIDDEVSVIIRNELGERFYEKIVKSGEKISYELPSDFQSGNYEIEASNGDINSIRNFFVNQKAKVSFELVDNTLVVTNVGNVPYKKSIEININDNHFVKQVSLGLGESVSFKLTGEEGSYDVVVSDGASEFSQSGVPLTGRVVDVDQLGVGLSLASPIFWIFFIIIIALILLFIFRDVLKKRSFAIHGMIRNKAVSNSPVQISHNQNNIENYKMPVVKKPEVKMTDGSGKVMHSQADQVMVMKGHRSKVAVLILKVKNKLGDSEKKSLEKAMEPVYAKRGAVYEHGDYIFALFSPLMTRAQNNEALAALSGQEIVKILNEHNRRYREKIDFGIAINSGELINKVENGKLKFTVLGSFIASAKRLAELSDKQVLLSEESFQKAGSEVKADRLDHHRAYNLRRVVDSEKNNKFIKGFLDRQRKDSL